MKTRTRAISIYMLRPRFRFPKRYPMLFPIDLDDTLHWNSFDSDVKPTPTFSFPTHYEFYDSTYNPPEPLDELATWINDPDFSPSSPIPISSPSDTNISPASSYNPYDQFSPAGFAAMHPLPRSMSPPSPFEDNRARPRVYSAVSPSDMSSLHTPSWTTQLWDTPSPQRTIYRPSVRHSPLSTTSDLATIRVRRPSLQSSATFFQSSSAPTETLTPAMSRPYTRRADSVTDDRDATVRRSKKRSQEDDAPVPSTSKPAADSRKQNSPPNPLSPFS